MRNKTELKANFDELADFLGSAQGWEESVKTPYYIGQLIEMAHGIAAQAFDTEAAVVARPLNFTHMYEWGAIGINEGYQTPKLNPTSRAARLWAHRLAGTGSSRSIDFIFRPSVVDVPIPEHIATLPMKQRPKTKHKFMARPWIIEYGVSMTIRPKNSSVLMIPIEPGTEANGVGRYSNSRAVKRGYFMHPYPVKIGPSKNAGQFTAFWNVWWNKEGRRIINETTDKVVNQQAAAIIQTGRGRGTMLSKYAKGKTLTKTFKMRVETAKAKANAESKVKASNSLTQWQREEMQRGMA